MMTRFASIVFATLYSLSSYGQASIAPIAGFSKINGAADVLGIRLPTSSINGFVAGAVAEFPMSPKAFVQSGIVASTDGFSLPGFLFLSQELKAYNVQVPLYVQYKIGKEEGNKIFMGAGFYAAYNIYSSVVHLYVAATPDSLQQYVPIIKPVSFGYGFNAGYELKNGLFLRLGYQHGLANIFVHDDVTKASFKPYQVNACMGYFIRKNRR